MPSSYRICAINKGPDLTAQMVWSFALCTWYITFLYNDLNNRHNYKYSKIYIFFKIILYIHNSNDCQNWNNQTLAHYYFTEFWFLTNGSEIKSKTRSCILGSGYTWKSCCHFSQRRKLQIFSVCFPSYKSPSQKGSILKRKNLLPMGANSFLFRIDPFPEGKKRIW